MALTVKAYLKRVGQNQTEIRRFAVDNDVSTQYHVFVGKVTTVFPGLHLKKFTMAWRDSENDLIQFSSDEELVEAVAGAIDDVFKVYIDEKEDDAPTSARPVQCGGGRRQRVHRGVTCDGCNGPVVGVRHKCEVCPDYDLCETCKSTGLHSEHSMMPIERPRHWNQFGFGPRGMFPWGVEGGPSMMNMPPHPMMNMPPPPMGDMTGSPPPPYMGQGMDWETRRLQRRAWRRWMRETFRENKHCRKAEKRCKRDAKKQEKREKRKAMETDGASAGATEEGKEKCIYVSSSTSSSSGSSDECETGAAGDKYLKDVGQSVAAMLDPLGIDVEVNVEQRGGPRRGHCHRGGMGSGMRGGGMWGGPWRGHGGWGGRGGGWGHGFGRGGQCGRGGAGGPWGGCPWGRGWGASSAATMAAETVPQGPQGPSGPVPQGPQGPSDPVPQGPKGSSDPVPVVSTAQKTNEQVETGPVGGSPPETSGWMFVQQDGGNGGVEGATSGVANLKVSTEGADAEASAVTAPATATSLATSAPINKTVAAAIEKMKTMGFTDEGGWLTALLSAHNGDLNAALEVINAANKK